MSNVKQSIRPPRSDEDLARMVVNVAKATQVNGIIAITETGALAQHLFRLSSGFRVIAATTNGKTYDTLTKAGLETIRLPLRTADKYTQIRHAVSVVLRSSRVSVGDFVICTIGRDVYEEGGDLVVLTEVEASFEKPAVHDLLKLTDGIQPTVLESAVLVACKIGRPGAESP